MNLRTILLTIIGIVCLVGGLAVIQTDGSDAVSSSGTCGTNLTWVHDSSTGVLTISGSGTTMTDFTSTADNPFFNLNITKIVWNCPNLTHIGNNAFASHSTLTDMGELPKGLLSIGDSAFLSTGVNATSLPYTITSIGQGSFQYCTSLALTKLPDKLDHIGINAFDGCTSLAIKTVPYGVHSIPNGAFEGCTSLSVFIIPDSVTYIADTAFAGTTNLTKVGNLANLDISTLFPNVTGAMTVTNSGTCGTNLNWAYFGEVTTLYIYGNGTTMTNWSSSTAHPPWYDYRTSITHAVLDTPNLTSLGVRIFENHGKLIDTSLPNVKVIPSYAFYACDKLKLESLPDGVTTIQLYAFYACSELALNELPRGITTIQAYSFAYCSKLALHELPPNLTRVEAETFHGCTALAIEKLPENINYIGGNAFQGCSNLELTELPAGLTVLEGYTFQNCSKLNLTTLPQGLTRIGSGAFMNCTSLTEFTLPESVTRIESAVFDGCTNLTTLTVESTNLTLVQSGVFRNNSKLNDVWVGENVSVLPNNLFHILTLKTVHFNATNCADLASDNTVFSGTIVETIIFGDNLQHIPAYLAKDMKTTLESVSLNDGLESIGQHAFDGCTNLVLLSLPDSVTEVNAYAFYGCTNVALVKLPENITDIGARSFEGSRVVFTVLPDSLNNVHAHAFENCTSLTALVLGPNVDIAFGGSAFEGCTNLKEILNLSQMEIVRGSTDNGYIAYYADTVADHIESGAMVQQKDHIEHSVVTKDDATSVILRILPVLIAVAVMMSVMGMMYVRTKE